VLKFDLAN